MRLDWEIAKRGYRSYAAYPAATAAGVFTNTVFGFMQAYILLAVFASRTDVGGYDAQDAVTFTKWEGLEPERNGGGGRYPRMAVYSIGLKATMF